MYCPLTMIDKHAQIEKCTPDCAWAIVRDNKLMCSIPYFMAINPDKINSSIIEVDE